MIKITYTVGMSHVVCEGANLKAVAQQSALFGALAARSKCDACGSDKTFLSHREAQGNSFFFMECSACTGQLKIGTLKAGGYFVKRESKYEVYQGKAKTDDPMPAGNSEDFSPVADDAPDVPF